MGTPILPSIYALLYNIIVSIAGLFTVLLFL